MTDAEIIKALGLCSSEHLGCEDGCPYTMQACRGGDAVMKDALALINRQKAEIERLKIRNDELNALNKSASIEAIKEFAERLKATVYDSSLQNGDVHFVALYKAIDEVAKELTE